MGVFHEWFYFFLSRGWEGLVKEQTRIKPLCLHSDMWNHSHYKHWLIHQLLWLNSFFSILVTHILHLYFTSILYYSWHSSKFPLACYSLLPFWLIFSVLKKTLLFPSQASWWLTVKSTWKFDTFWKEIPLCSLPCQWPRSRDTSCMSRA